jgi:DNA-directed RNA polymerase subunit M/transcription elongation factor TFIIS
MSQDIFQFFVGSSDTPAPGKGTGETLVSPSSKYAELRKIVGWRRLLANTETPEEEQKRILALTHDAQLWLAPPRKEKTRRVDLESLRVSLLAPKTEQSTEVDTMDFGDAALVPPPEDPAGVAIDLLKRFYAVAAPETDEGKMRTAWTKYGPGLFKILSEQKKYAAHKELAEQLGREYEESVGAPRPQPIGGSETSSVAPAPEEAVAKKKAAPKSRGKKKESVAAGLASAATANVSAMPQGKLAAAVEELNAGLEVTPPDVSGEERKESAIHFCPTCNYYLYLNVMGDEQELVRICRNCGFQEKDTKGGLISELLIQEQSSEAYKILLHEHTHLDPRLPHLRGSMKCPNSACESNTGGKESDIIYMKYDAVNMLFIYICTICDTKWRSKR